MATLVLLGRKTFAAMEYDFHVEVQNQSNLGSVGEKRKRLHLPSLPLALDQAMRRIVSLYEHLKQVASPAGH